MSELLAAARAALTAPGGYFAVDDEDVRGTKMPVFTHRVRSLRTLLDGTARFPDRTYLVDGDVRLDFGSHLEQVDALATAFQQQYGVGPGDRVAIAAANRWEWVVAFWAIATAGAVSCAYNGWWTPAEVAHATALVEPTLIIGDERRLDIAAAAGVGLPVIDLDEVGDLVDAHRGIPPARSDVAEDDPAVLIFTSGTTGPPKAVTTPHRGLCGFLQVNAFAESHARVVLGGEVPAVGDELPLADDVVLVTSPLFHLSMLYGVVLRAVVKGSTGVLLPGRFDPERVLGTIERERVTSWLALGSAAPRVCTSPARDRFDTSTLEHVGIGGAPVSPAVQDAIRATFPRASDRLTMGYASTESVAVVASIGGPEYAAHPTSTGRVNATIAVEVRSEGGAALPDGELGEIHVRSPYTMLGYWRDPEASAAVLKDDGWLAMGDLGRIVDERLYIDTRARDMLLVSAENVSPTEVEHRLEAHADVLEAAVFAVDDEVTGDAVCGVVVTDAASGATVDDLAAWCRITLSHYKVPTHWHIVHEHLPRTASGKLVKHEIRRLVGLG